MPNKTILIADDEPYLIRSLSYVLQREGYTVESAMDGQEAMAKIEALRPIRSFSTCSYLFWTGLRSAGGSRAGLNFVRSMSSC